MAAPAMRAPALKGRWLTAAARHCFSLESFERLVEPALADLQREDSGRVGAWVDAYATVWIGMAAACDQGMAQRARAFVRDNELVTLTALVLLHTAHSGWMVVLLLGLDGRVHLENVLASAWTSLPAPALLALSSGVAVYFLRALARRMIRGPAAPHLSITVRAAE
jgi:hypothetical protein